MNSFQEAVDSLCSRKSLILLEFPAVPNLEEIGSYVEVAILRGQPQFDHHEDRAGDDCNRRDPVGDRTYDFPVEFTVHDSTFTAALAPRAIAGGLKTLTTSHRCVELAKADNVGAWRVCGELLLIARLNNSPTHKKRPKASAEPKAAWINWGGSKSPEVRPA